MLIPRTELRDRLFATEGYKGLTGVLTCDDHGDCQPEATIAIRQVRAGRFGQPIKTYTISLDEAGEGSIIGSDQ